MKKKRCLFWSFFFLSLFAGWTMAVSNLDVQAIGPVGTSVGFAELNSFAHNLTGIHMELYALTDWLGFIPLFIVMGFALLGLIQWVQRKSILKVDRSILILGGFYLVTLGVFLFFENCVINFRPVLIEGMLEASYPSSTTMLVICVMSTAVIQLKERIHNCELKSRAAVLIYGFTVFMVAGRLLSGVHWFTDIVGGILVSTGLVLLYAGIQ